VFASALSASSCKKDWDRSALPVSAFQLFSFCLSLFPPLPPVRKFGFPILLTADHADNTDARSDLFHHKDTETQRAEWGLNSALSVSSCKKDWDRSALPVSAFSSFLQRPLKTGSFLLEHRNFYRLVSRFPQASHSRRLAPFGAFAIPCK
jgi:hypothetical protein